MRALGCDIGNGFAYVSVLNDVGKLVVAVPPKWARDGMPTDVLVKGDGTIVTGRLLPRGHTRVRAVKRDLNNYLNVEGKEIDPLEAYARIAQTVLDESFTRLSKSGQNPPHEIVLTYPASFISTPRTVNRIVDAVSGLLAPDGEPYVVCGTIPEPTAIALDFLATHESKEKAVVCVAVYDLGHGTFDSALVTCDVNNGSKSWRVHDYGCLGSIGGINFDDALVSLIKKKINEQNGATTFNNSDEQTILDLATRIKHTLTDEHEIIVDDLFLSSGVSNSLIITRKEFEECIQDLVMITIKEFDVIIQESRQLGLELDYVALSGGSSQVPLVERKVRDLVESRFEGSVKVCLHNPTTAVSFGAARYASLMGEMVPARSVHATAVDNSPIGRMRRLYEPLNISGMAKQAERFTIAAMRSMGVVDDHDLSLLICIPEGADLPATSKEFVYVPNTSHISLLVGRARYVGRKEGVLRHGEYEQVIRLHCGGAHIGERYMVTLGMDCVGVIRITLVGESGHVLRMR